MTIFTAQKRTFTFTLSILLLIAVIAYAQLPPEKSTADQWLEKNQATLKKVNEQIWNFAELGLEEYKSSQTLIELLQQNGFKIDSNLADMPTAFIASYGSGKPVIAILAEYDALPGLSQKASPEKDPRPETQNGHGCGHCLIGTASAGAAIAARYAMQKHNLKGTIRLYGTPAEETLIGKVYMANAGLFDDCNAVLWWHPGSRTAPFYSTTKAAVSIKYTFHGLASHASIAPSKGKSALDAVELMDVGANFLREHLPEDARIGYTITNGGDRPNIVPPTAQVWYYLRANKHSDVEYIFQRMLNMAKGAALMTDTTFDYYIDSDCFEVLPNLPLSQLLYKNLELAGPPKFSQDDKIFAEKIQKSLESPPKCLLSEVIGPLPDEPNKTGGSTDAGNVSWIVPTGAVDVACHPCGAPLHSWQVTACSGSSIGEKGLFTAARALAYSAVDLLTDPKLLANADEDFQKRSKDKPTSLLPKSQKPPQKPK